MNFSPTHHAGDACPADMFAVSPPEALRSATFTCDVQVVGQGPPYEVRFCGKESAINLEVDHALRPTIDRKGLLLVGVDPRYVRPGDRFDQVADRLAATPAPEIR